MMKRIEHHRDDAPGTRNATKSIRKTYIESTTPPTKSRYSDTDDSNVI